jgi:hypothetical protein
MLMLTIETYECNFMITYLSYTINAVFTCHMVAKKADPSDRAV